MNEISPELQVDLDQICSLWQQGLEKFNGPFLAGQKFTAVDAFFAPIAFRIQTYNLELNEACSQYINLILNLPAMKEWYQSAIEEKWRDSPHEVEIDKVGKIISDYRAEV